MQRQTAKFFSKTPITVELGGFLSVPLVFYNKSLRNLPFKAHFKYRAFILPVNFTLLFFKQLD